MKGTVTNTQVAGQGFEVWSDFIERATFAKSLKTGETKAISSSGYIRNDLTVRKAIALVFRLETFRKN